MESPLLLLVAFVAVIVASSVQVGVGFGFALVCAPILVVVDPAFVPAPIVLCGLVLSGWTFAKERHRADLPGLRWAWAGRVPGTAIGAIVLTIVPASRTAVVVAVVILVAVGVSLLRWRPRPTPRTLFTAGVLSGVMGTAAGTGGPPLALVYQRATGPELRAAMSGSLVVGAAISSVALVAAGRLGWAELRAFGLLAAPMAVGIAVAPWTAHHVDRGGARRVVLALSGLSALAILARELV